MPLGGSSFSGPDAAWAARGRAVAGLLIALLAAVPCAAQSPASGAESWAAGRPLAGALAALQARGLPLVWSSRVVRPELAVVATPRALEPRAILDELLAAHGLAVEERAGSLIVVVAAPGGGSGAEPPAAPAPGVAGTVREEIFVYPSRLSLLEEEPAAPLALSRDQIQALPHLGGDVFRALSLLPGTAANDISAQFHVRGGRRDEVVIRLDGQELYEAFHLKDFDSALSVVPAATLASLDLTTGSFPVSYGDRMGAVLDLSTVAPAAPPHGRILLSAVDAQVEASGTLGERASWLAAMRPGTTQLAGRFFGKEDPIFGSLLGKLDVQATPRRSLRVNLLHSSDRLDFLDRREDALTGLDTGYDSSYAWATLREILSGRLFVDAALSGTAIRRDRRGREDEEEKRFDVRDERDLTVAGLAGSWNLQATPEHFLRGGIDLRRFAADYAYASDRAFTSALAALRAEPRDGAFDFRGRFDDDYLGAFVSDRFQPAGPLTLEAGVRYDRHSLTGDRVWSPRAHLAWAVGETTVVRAGWGVYRQSQRAYEVMVEDGDTRLYPAERSEHQILGWERRFAAGEHPLAVRVEAYRREIRDPRPRYESLFEPFEPFPEGELDRFRFEPERARSRGVELFVQWRAGRLDGWANYGWAEAEDTIAGATVPRQIDQRHTVNLDLHCQLPRRWEVSLAGRFHTGRPTTAISLAAVEGEDGEDGDEGDGGEVELVPILGPLNRERLGDYYRLDLRLSRRWNLPRGRLDLFFDVQNLTNRSNPSGFDIELDEDAERLRIREEHWPGFLASGGVAWEF